MKKLVALLLSCVVMTASVASAETTATWSNDSSVSKNDNAAALVTAQKDAENKNIMPCFRAGDTIKFDLAGLTAGTSVTLISGLVSANGAYADDNVQYINQYDNVTASETVDFIVRDSQEGIYNIKINDGTETKIFYYMVANPVIETLEGGTQDQPTNYYVKGDAYTGTDGTFHNLGYVGTVTMGTDEVSLADAGIVNLGFTITKENTSKKYNLGENENSATFLSTTSKVEAGTVIYHYGVELNRVPEEVVDSIKVVAVEIDKSGNVVSASSAEVSQEEVAQ